MSIENNLKKIVNFGYPRFQVSDTDEINNNEIVICTDDEPDISGIELAICPKRLVLSCEVCADSVDVSPKVSMNSYSENIYALQFPAYKSVSLKYVGFGKLIFDDGTIVNFYDDRVGAYNLQINNVLLRQEFAYQKEDIVHVDIPKELRLMAYGGQFKPNDDISKIQQIFFQIKHMQGAIGIAISDEVFWNNRGIDPFVGGIFYGNSDIKVIAPIGCVKQPNVSEQIANGAIKIPIASESGEKFIFHSRAYSQNANKVDIIFDI